MRHLNAGVQFFHAQTRHVSGLAWNDCPAPAISSGIRTRSCGTWCPRPSPSCSWPR
jgi:hypothetical protein